MKALLRRAKARSEQGGWGSLQGAEEGIVLEAILSRLLADFKKTTRT